mgnify:CR=1 FL=1
MGAIVAFEIEITEMKNVFKLSQDRDQASYQNIIAKLKEQDEAGRAIASGRELVSALFVIPYPPGFPILVPGQIISAAILEYLNALDVREIHGFRPELGFRVFTEEALAHARQVKLPKPQKAAGSGRGGVSS